MTKFIPPYIKTMPPYVPGRRIQDVAREYGVENIHKLASNENPLGPSPMAVQALSQAISGLHRYSDADAGDLKKALADKFHFSPDDIVCSNGSSELILLLSLIVCGPGLNAVMSRPSFILYAQDIQASGAEAREVALTADFGHDLESLLKQVDENTRLVFIDNPLNPTGAFLEPEQISAFYEALPSTTLMVLDEAYIEFAADRKRPDYPAWLQKYDRLIILRTFSKAYGLAGLRSAYGVMPKDLAQALNKVRQPFNMNLLAQIGAEAAINDDEFLTKSVAAAKESLSYISRELSALGLKVYPSEGNYVMAALPEGYLAEEVASALMRRGIIVRPLTSFGLDKYFRVSAGLMDESRALVEAMKEIIN